MSGALAVVRPTKVRKEAKITCLVSFAPVFSFIWGRENWMFCLVCLPGVSWLLFEYISSVIQFDKYFHPVVLYGEYLLT